MAFSFFGWGGGNTPVDELPIIFPLEIAKPLFIEIDVIHIFSKILTDVIDRCDGLTDEQVALLFDNCLKSEANLGLIHMLAKAMTLRQQLFVVYDKALPVLRKATSQEQAEIEADYRAKNKSDIGVWISFEKYIKADLVRLYSALEYITIASLNKSMNLSSALQLKFNDMRASTGLTDAAEVKSQAMAMAKSLGAGRDIMMDAKDVVETVPPDLTAVQASIDYLNSKRAFYLGMPCSYLEGEQSQGLASTGEGDVKATERGLKNYFISIIKPVLEAIFDEAKIEYKTQNYSQIDSAINALKAFAITDDEYISADNKVLIMNRLFDLPDDSGGDAPDPVQKLLAAGELTVPLPPGQTPKPTNVPPKA